MDSDESLVGGHVELLMHMLPSPQQHYSKSPADALSALAPRMEAPMLRRSLKGENANGLQKERREEGAMPPGSQGSQKEKKPFVVSMNHSTRNEGQFHIGAKKVLEGEEKPKRNQKVFLESAAWFTVQGIIISFFTDDILDSIEEWRSGYQIFFVFIAVLVLWWSILRPLIRDYAVSKYDEDSRWDAGVHAANQLITTALVIITAQYAARILRDSWNVRSFSPTDRIAQLFVIALIFGDIVYTVREAEKLHLYDADFL